MIVRKKLSLLGQYLRNAFLRCHRFIIMSLLMLFFLFLLVSRDPPVEEPSAPTREPLPSTLTVHVVMHSHVDPGWLQTFEEYYSSKVQNTLNLAVKHLTEHPDLRFIWSEMSFLERWWVDATADNRQKMKNLVKSGQLELSGGGWVVPDEATTHFFGTIDGLIEGHWFVQQELNVTPSTSWSVDPFGHGLMMPFLLPQAGIDHMVIGRVDKQVKDELKANRSLLFSWKQLHGIQKDKNPLVFTLPNTFYTISDSCGLNQSICCMFELGPSSTNGCEGKFHFTNDSSVEQYASLLVQQFYTLTPFYSGSNILVPVGGDFYFSEEGDWSETYDSYSKLFEYINDNANVLRVQVKFSTVKEYFAAVLEEQGPSLKDLPVLQRDFFPYSDDTESNYPYWTGFFVHRPFFKRAERLAEMKLRAVDLLSIRARFGQVVDQMRTARRALALCQHHDAITGTSRPLVMEDYMSRLSSAFKTFNEELMAMFKQSITRGQQPYSLLVYPDPKWTSGDGATNVLTVTFSKKLNERHQLLIFNQNPQEKLQKIVLRVNKATVHVVSGGSSAESIKAQILPVVNFAVGEIMEDLFELVFFIWLKPLQLNFVFLVLTDKLVESTVVSKIYSQKLNGESWKPIRKLTSSLRLATSPVFEFEQRDQDLGFVLANSFFSVVFDTNGLVIGLRYPDNSVFDLNIEYRNETDSGGAYVFLREPPILVARDYGEKERRMAEFSPIYVVGELTSKAITFTSPELIQTVVVDNSLTGNVDQALHLDLFSSQKSKDMMRMMNLKTPGVKNGQTFHTDANGLYLVERLYRDQVPYEGNFYPVVTAVCIDDEARRVTLLTGQPTGATFYDQGLHVMVDRRLAGNDDKGLRYGDGSFAEPSLLKYVIVVEKKVSSGTGSAKFHSHVGYSLLQNLLYQPELLLLNQKQATIALFEDVAWPCDIELINSRFLDARTGLVLMRRLEFDETLEQTCKKTENFDTLWASLKVISQGSPLVLTSLTATVDKSVVSDAVELKELFVEPFKIVTLKFRTKG